MAQAPRQPRLLAPAMAMAVAATVVFIGLLVAVAGGALGRGSVDAQADSAAHAAVLAHPTLLSLARGLANLGAPVVVDLIAAVAALGLWLTGHRRAAVYVVLVRVAAQILDSTVKVLVSRARPAFTHPVAHATGYSFPSGHAVGAASVYLPLAVLAYAWFTRTAFRSIAVAAAVVICLAVGTTRVLLGVHYPSDVLAGLALGLALTAGLTPILGQRS